MRDEIVALLRRLNSSCCGRVYLMMVEVGVARVELHYTTLVLEDTAVMHAVVDHLGNSKCKPIIAVAAPDRLPLVDTLHVNAAVLLLQRAFYQRWDVTARCVAGGNNRREQEFDPGCSAKAPTTALDTTILIDIKGQFSLAFGNVQPLPLDITELHSALCMFERWLPTALNVDKFTPFSMPPVPAALAPLLSPIQPRTVVATPAGWTPIPFEMTALDAPVALRGYRNPQWFIDDPRIQSLPAGSVALFVDEPRCRDYYGAGLCPVFCCPGVEVALKGVLCSIHTNVTTQRAVSPIIRFLDDHTGPVGMRMQLCPFQRFMVQWGAAFFRRCPTCHIPRVVVLCGQEEEVLDTCTNCVDFYAPIPGLVARIVDWIANRVAVHLLQAPAEEQYFQVLTEDSSGPIQLDMAATVTFRAMSRMSTKKYPVDWLPQRMNPVEHEHLHRVLRLLEVMAPIPEPTHAEVSEAEQFHVILEGLFPYRLGAFCPNAAGGAVAEVDLFCEDVPQHASGLWGMRRVALMQLHSMLTTGLLKTLQTVPTQHHLDFLLRSPLGGLGYLLRRQRTFAARTFLIQLGAAPARSMDRELIDREHARCSSAAAAVSAVAQSVMDVPACVSMEDVVLRATQLEELFLDVGEHIHMRPLQCVNSTTTTTKGVRGALVRSTLGQPLTQELEEKSLSDFETSAQIIEAEHRAEEENLRRALSPPVYTDAVCDAQYAGLCDDASALRNLCQDVIALSTAWRVREEHTVGKLPGVESGLMSVMKIVWKHGWDRMAASAAPWHQEPSDEHDLERLVSTMCERFATAVPAHVGVFPNSLCGGILSAIGDMGREYTTVVPDHRVYADIAQFYTASEERHRRSGDHIPLVQAFLQRTPTVRPLDVLDKRDRRCPVLLALRSPHRLDVDMAEDVMHAGQRWTVEPGTPVVAADNKPRRCFGPPTLGLVWVRRRRRTPATATAVLTVRNLLCAHGVDPRAYTPRGPKATGAIAALLLRNQSVLGEVDVLTKRALARAFFEDSSADIDDVLPRGAVNRELALHANSAPLQISTRLGLQGAGLTWEEIQACPEGRFLLGSRAETTPLPPATTIPLLSLAPDMIKSRIPALSCGRASHLAAVPDLARHLGGVECARLAQGERRVITSLPVSRYTPGEMERRLTLPAADPNRRVGFLFQHIGKPVPNPSIHTLSMILWMRLSKDEAHRVPPPRYLSPDHKFHLFAEGRIFCATIEQLVRGHSLRKLFARHALSQLKAYSIGNISTTAAAALFLLETATFANGLSCPEDQLLEAQQVLQSLREVVINTKKHQWATKAHIAQICLALGPELPSRHAYDIFVELIPSLEDLLSMAKTIIHKKDICTCGSC